MPKGETFRMVEESEKLLYEGIKTASNKIVIMSADDDVLIQHC
ncbi:hypothetical protein [Dethiobacter alkaliphilus]|nr:hypothetical protein [Dethiobacter alkaliphilus]MCW3491524.1 hypothetical protein [Dethiobacter alkaliphilus]